MAIFRAGDPCLLFDKKGRRYLIDLIVGKDFQYHRGLLPHDSIIGQDDGVVLESTLGARLVAVRPRLADYALKMSRGAAVVYPKDAGSIVMWADIAPGQTVLEAGTGSGALTMSLLRAVGPEGTVISYERREDHAKKAKKLIRGFMGEIPANLHLHLGDVEDAIDEVKPDRLILDLPEPWHMVSAAARSLVNGGIFCCYLPTVPQLQSVRKALGAAGFFDAETFEVLRREWAVEGRSVRPDHRMVGHTGFITTARKIQTTAPVELPPEIDAEAALPSDGGE